MTATEVTVNMRELGQRAKAQRLALNLSPEEVAAAIKLKPESYLQIEYGHNTISLTTLCRLHAALNVSADYLLYGINVHTSGQSEREFLIENIEANLSVCSEKQLRRLQKIVAEIIQDIVDK